MRSISVVSLAFCLISASGLNAQQPAPSAQTSSNDKTHERAENHSAAEAGVAFVPIQFRNDSGTRPFVPVSMNGKPFLMMVHANAKLYAMTTHANAASIGLADPGKNSNYGISSAGHLSNLGRGEATLASLQVGSSRSSNVALSVFEIPQTPPTDGILGMDWLRDQRAIVDYDEYRLGIPSSLQASRLLDQHLLARGLVAHHMTWDPTTQGFYVICQIGGVTTRMGVSTVAQIVIDSNFARAAGLELGPVVDQNGGPQGALVDSMLFKRQVSVVIDGQKVASAQPLSFDLSAYSSVKQPTGPHDDGYLGADFMLANQAVIDFGTETLFLALQK
jgi:hypothetical protein